MTQAIDITPEQQPAEEPDRSAEVTLFHEHARWTGVTDSDRAGWLKYRSRLITASKMAGLLGLHPKLDPLGIYVEMIMDAPINDVKLDLNSPLRWGKAFERTIAENAAEEFGWKLHMSGALLVSRAHPNIGATLDAEIIEDGQNIVYEGKFWSAFALKDWDEETGTAPEHILIQAQSQLLVTGAETCYVCALVGSRFVKIPVTAYKPLQDFMIERVDTFMDQVANKIPPPPTSKSADAIKALYPADSGAIVQLPAECLAWAVEIDKLKEEIKVRDERREELKNQLKLSIGEATYGLLPGEVAGKSAVKFALEHKDAYMVKEQNNRVMRFVKGLPKGVR